MSYSWGGSTTAVKYDFRLFDLIRVNVSCSEQSLNIKYILNRSDSTYNNFAYIYLPAVIAMFAVLFAVKYE